MELTASIQPALSEEKLYTQPLASGEQNFHPTGEHLPLTLAEIELTAIHRWQKMVERFPANRALEEGDRIQSYAELNKQMNQLAYAIMAHKLSPDQPVAILFDLESDLLTAIWAVWKAGNFFVWLEPTHPQLRNQAIIENSGAPLIVTNRHYAALARDLVPDVAYLVILEDLSADLPVSDPPITITGDTPAYLCYTSGSTGKPKGVVDNHCNLLESVMVRQVIFHFSTHDRVNLLARASGWSFSAFAALMYGGCLLPCRVVEEGFVHFSQWLIDRRVTITIGGAVLRAWLSTLDGSQQFPDLRGISLGASASYREHFQAYQQYLPDHCVFLNTYSATEVRSATFFVTGKNSQIETRLLPAGFPTYRGTIEIWDDNGKPLPVGKTGEVVVFTPYTARGYWKSPELTASRFGVDAQGRHYYRMGDLGRLDEQGCLWVLGRADGQIKIRSHRVEIAEVEVALLELPAVHETAVIYIGESDETRALIAFVAMQQKVAGQEIRSQLTAHLPDYMIPAAVIVLDELPHNANGKIARPLLRDMASALSKTVINSRSFEATSRDGTEARITKMINELLPGERIGPDDNFFDHGGHSLLAARLMLSIYHTFGVDLPPRDFLANPTIASLSASVDRALIEQAKATPTTTAETEQEIEAVELWTGSTAVLPLFICLGANGSKAVMMGYQELIRRMGNRTPIYALLPKGTNGGREPFSTMDILVDAALDALRRIQPHGPYHLIGDCHGGKLAYQLALALKAVGEEIAFLGLLDSPARPSWADAPPAVEKWMKAKHKVKAWHGRIVYHGQQLGEMGWQAAIIYLGEHIAALLPDAVRPQSSTHSQFLVHKGYQELLQSFEPYEPLDARVTAVFSHQFQHHQATWAKLIDDLDVTSIGSQHESVLRACIDETAAVIRKALLASQRPNKPE